MNLLLASLVALLAGSVSSLVLRSNRASAVAALASQALSCALMLVAVIPVLSSGMSLSATWSGPEPVGRVAFEVDALSAFFLVWSLPLTLLGTVYATSYLTPHLNSGRRGGPHFALLNLVSASFIIVYSVRHALVFLLGWEIAAVAAWLLVIWDYTNQKIRFAGFNYLVSTHVGLFVLVAAFMRLHARTGSFDFSAFGDFLSRPSPIRGSVFCLLGVAFALKSAFFPFHTWLPRAHSAAPAHVSALMSGVIHKAGLFGFLRFTLLLGTPDEWMGWTVLAFGALSAFAGALYTVPQRDLKRALGYSSTENVGVAAMGFGTGMLGLTWGTPALAICGFAGGLFHILNHALFKCLLFYTAGAIYRAVHTVDIERLGGLARKLPVAAGCFLLGGLAISALPPLNGFHGELLIYGGLLSGAARHPLGLTAFGAAAAVLAFTGGVSALAMTRLFGVAFLGHPRDRNAHVEGPTPVGMALPMIVHASLMLAVGLAPTLGVSAIEPILDLFPRAREGHAALALLEPATTASRALAIAVALAVLVAHRLGHAARRGPTWGCGYTEGTTRMQYTGSGLSEAFSRVFENLLPALRRERLPGIPFPRNASQIGTHHYDAVERRVFEALGHGEQTVTRAADRMPHTARFAFAAGLAVLVAVGLFVGGGR